MNSPPEISARTTEPPRVSVAVISYNHEKYIAQCIDSILAQQAGFSFEVVVRDDCSNDSTPRILREYAARFPGMLRLLDGSRNLGMNRNLLEVLRQCTAPWIALCEGDDYWTDPEKLRLQFATTQSRPFVSFVSHACRNHGRLGLGEPQYVKGPTGTIDVRWQDVLDVAGQFAPTASYMFRRELVGALPNWFADASVGDFFLEMYALGLGHGVHINRAMSAYRTFSENSWSTQNNENRSQKLVKFSSNMTLCLERMRSDPRFATCDFTRKLAASTFNTAIGALILRDYEMFRSEIEKCWASVPRLSRTQQVLHALRNLPQLARTLYLFKRGQALRTS